MKGRKISKSVERFFTNDTTSSGSDIVMKSVNGKVKESKFVRRSTSPDNELHRMHTFQPKEDEEMFALKIISKQKVLETAQ